MSDINEEGGVASRLGGVVRRGLSGMVNSTRSARIKMEIASLNGQKLDRFTEIGKKVYALYESGLVRNAELLDLCSQLRQVDLDIMERERYLAALREDSGAGAAMPPAPYEGGIEDYSPNDRGGI